MGGTPRRRSPRRTWPRAGPVTPTPLRSYAPTVKEVSAVEVYPALRSSTDEVTRAAATTMLGRRRCPDGARRWRRRTTQQRPRLVAMQRWQSRG